MAFDPYTPFHLRFYDAWVCGVSNHFIWRCPTREILDLYRVNMTANHLDAGVGTGYFLDRARIPSRSPRVVLLDINESCLHATARRLRRHLPETVRADVLAPLPDMPKFDSISMTYLLHCLPGSMQSKAAVFDHLAPLLAAGGVLFGATVLRDAAKPNPFARRLMALYNRLHVFDNDGDDAATLRHALESRFASVELRIIGYVALFAVRV